MKTTINGKEFKFEANAHDTAIEIIREKAGLTGTKLSCGSGNCLYKKSVSAP